jgi:hypothetical protein
MKTLIEYINESLSKNEFGFFDNGVFKIKTKTDSIEDETTRNSVAKEQEKEIIDIINNYLTDSKYNAISSVDYAENIEKTKWNSKYDLEHGDIVIVDDSNKPVMFIDVKVSDKKDLFGAITINSLLNFGKTSDDHYYLLLSDLGVKHKLVKGKDVWNEFEKNKTLLVSKNRKHKIDFDDVNVKDWGDYHSNGEVYAEDFIPTSTINEIKPAI